MSLHSRYNDKNVYVMGAVNTPRSISYRDGLPSCGNSRSRGFTKYASQNDTMIYRKNGAREITITSDEELINDVTLLRTFGFSG